MDYSMPLPAPIPQGLEGAPYKGVILVRVKMGVPNESVAQLVEHVTLSAGVEICFCTT